MHSITKFYNTVIGYHNMFLNDFSQSFHSYTYDDISSSLVLGHIRNLRKNGNYDNVVTTTKKYLTHDYSLHDIAELVAKDMNKPFITGLCDTIMINDQTDPGLLVVLYGALNGTSTAKLKVDFTAHFTGSRVQVENLEKSFDNKFNRNAEIHWYYVSKGHAESVSMTIPNDVVIHDEYYPWFPKGPKEFFKRYMESSCPILFISGEPGVGKTSFLRAMIVEFGLSTYVGYDEKLFNSDGMFIDFLVNSSADLLVMEDAETLVLPRKADNNTLIARLLNVSDGIIRLPNKKFIFTTNESGFSNVDDALLRPGRCFDSIEFRSLKYDEAVLAAKKTGLPEPIVKKDYTLASLFNQQQKVQPRKIGF